MTTTTTPVGFHSENEGWLLEREHTDQLRSRALDGVAAILELMGEDPNRSGLVDTPARVVKAYLELTDRPGDPATILARTFDDANYDADEMVVVGPIDFTSLCEHHLMPFPGQAWVAYIPQGNRVVGLSKLPRVVEHYARRPQVQERMTTQIADALVEHLQPRGVGVVVSARHGCMGHRGVRKPKASMRTSVMRGAFKNNPETRAEFLSLTRAGEDQ